MTPRHADVAYVLEGIAAVRGVFAVSTATHDFAVAVERGGGTLAEVHYALLRVLSYEEIQRVHVFHTDAPPFMQGARAITLTEMDRAAARARVREPAARPPIVAWPGRRQHLRVLLVTNDRTIEPLVYDAFDSGAYCMPESDHVAAAELATRTDFDVILCDATHAFGLKGLLARLPLERADRVIVVTEPHDAEAARGRLQGDERILVKPVTAQALRQRVLQRPALTMAIAALAIAGMPPPRRNPATPARRSSRPASGEPFTAVLLDVPEDVAEALRRILPIDSRHLARAEALLSPFHVAFVSAKAALAKDSVLARASEKVIVLAPARDVAWVRHSLERDGHAKPRVVALPIDDALLAREVYRDHPELVARIAIRESDPFPAPRAVGEPMRVLIVDDDITTQMLRAAATPTDNVDVVLATSAMQAFEHVVSASVSVLVVSASMRSDGGEPLYRVLWRLEPALKARTILITNTDFSAPPSSASGDPSRRIVSRPLTAQVVGKIIELYRNS